MNLPLRVDLVIPSRIEHLQWVDRMTLQLAQGYELEDDERDYVGLAVHEAVANAIVHGNRSDERRFVRVCYILEKDRFLVEVQDEGAGFDPEILPDPTDPENLLKPGGRGLLFVRKFMDEVKFERLERGMRVELIKFARFQGLTA